MPVASVQAIQSLDGPDLAPYQTMRMQHDHWVQRIFIAEGDKVVRRLLGSELEVISALMPEPWLEQLRPLIEKRPEPVRVYTAAKPVLERLAGFSMYQGVLATGRIPEPLAMETAWLRSRRPRLFAAVEGITNAENIGAIVRNCAAFGTDALVVGETSSSPYLRRAVRASMGTLFRLPVLETLDLAETLSRLRQKGMRCVAAHPHADGRTLAQAELAGDCCIVFGSEGQGLAAPVLAACDDAVAVPMAAEVDSLNVASAAAVFLYEVSRQRGRFTGR